MPLHLSPHDRRLLRGDAGDGARLAMRLVVKAAEVAGAPRLIDIGSAHVGSCYSSGVTGLDFARRLAGSVTRVAVPTALNVAAADLLHCTPHRRRDPGFAQIRELVDLYLGMGCEETLTCAPYHLPGRPGLGDQVAWYESNAAVFANSVLGARTDLVLAALHMAIGQRRPDGGIHHSDKATRYTSLAFGKRCREMRVVTSTGSAGECFDNAMAESFFATLECELIDRRTFQSHAEARLAVFECIEAWYNRKRRHSAWGDLSPEECERTAAQDASRPAATTDQHDRTTRPGAVRIDDLEVHNGLQELSHPSAMGKTSPPPAIAHLRTGDESPNVSTRPG